MSYWVVIILTVVLDQVSKMWIVNNFELFQSKVIIPDFFNLTYVTNTGAAFSLLADVDSPWRHYFFLVVGIVALIILSVIWYRQRKASAYYTVSLALIAGGAAGNLIDRVRFGAVVDFIDIYISSYHWPAFNVADSAICIGVAMYLVFSFIEDNQKNN